MCVSKHKCGYRTAVKEKGFCSGKCFENKKACDTQLASFFSTNVYLVKNQSVQGHALSSNEDKCVFRIDGYLTLEIYEGPKSKGGGIGVKYSKYAT